MIYIKKQVDDIGIEIKLDENSVFNTKCGACGKTVEATEEILEDFTGFLFGSTRIYCEECTRKTKHDGSLGNKDNLTMEEKKITANELTAVYDYIARIHKVSHEMFAASENYFEPNALTFRGIEGASQTAMGILLGLLERNTAPNAGE